MTKYCLEITSDLAIIHQVECASYDLGTLLGTGRIVALGEFQGSLLALDTVKRSNTGAVRCLDCCHVDLVDLVDLVVVPQVRQARFMDCIAGRSYDLDQIAL